MRKVNPRERETVAGVGLSLPLPLADRPRATSELAGTRRRQAETAMRLAERELEREVLTTAASYAARQEEIARWAPDAAAKFRDAAGLADRHCRLGAVPLATYVELQNAYLDAIESLLTTEREAAFCEAPPSGQRPLEGLFPAGRVRAARPWVMLNRGRSTC